MNTLDQAVANAQQVIAAGDSQRLVPALQALIHAVTSGERVAVNPDIPMPTVHLNGTSGKDLLSEYDDFNDYMKDALEALHKTTLHPRDFYVQGDDECTFEKARAERRRIQTYLHVVSLYAELHVQHIREQGQ